MKIEANDKEIQDIFSLGYFKIPRFQRPYSWGIDEVESFWNDVVNEKGDSYFIGSMVVYQTKKPYFGIVDGQQRLTTITLILSAVRNSFIQLGEENLARGVHKYIEQANIDNEDEFVLKSETSFPYLQDHIQSFDGYSLDCDVGSEEQKLEAAYRFITDKLNALVPSSPAGKAVQASLFAEPGDDPVKVLKVVRDKILSLKLVFIQLDNEDDAYLIFETLNARGRDLTTSDLVKNLILNKLKTTSVAIDQAKESWNSIVRNFDDSTDVGVVDAFLLHFWLSEYSHTTDKKLFSEIKKHVDRDVGGARLLMSRLQSSAVLYSRLLSPDSFQWAREEISVKSSLKALNVFKVRQQSAMTLSLMRAYSERRVTLRNLKKVLGKIESFHYCFNAITSQRSSGTIASNYSRLAIKLSQAKSDGEVQVVFNELDDFLFGKLPDKKEFVVKFMELAYSSKRTKHKNIVKYTLSKLSPMETNGLPVNMEEFTIEHVLPEASARNGSSEELVSSIGNLILVDARTNSEDLADKPPKEKLDILVSKGYPLGSFFINGGEWDKAYIVKRAELLASHVYDLCYRMFR